MIRPCRILHALACALAMGAALLGGCAVTEPAPSAARPPSQVREQIVQLMPASVRDRAGWAADIYAALAVLRVEPDPGAVCSVLAVIEQESTYRVDPPVPRLGQISLEEMDRRADKAGIPKLLLHAALRLPSTDGRSYLERIEAARTEKSLSDTYRDFIGRVPMGERLFGGYNPVRTGGPMQVSIDFAERHARERPYPYPMAGGVRDEVFTRRGGLYFGIAHLLDYPARYDQPVYRFADFNAGRYASRNAAFQNAVSIVSGIPLDLDGDLVREGADADKPGNTELAVRALARRLDLSDGAVRRALEQGDGPDFDDSRLYRQVFELAERAERRALPRAVIPRIRLSSPKITRTLTTEWFARRVEDRHQRCMVRAAG